MNQLFPREFPENSPSAYPGKKGVSKAVSKAVPEVKKITRAMIDGVVLNGKPTDGTVPQKPTDILPKSSTYGCILLEHNGQLHLIRHNSRR